VKVKFVIVCHTDEYSAPDLKSESVHSWDDVVQAVKSLNGENKDTCILYRSEKFEREDFLCIEGPYKDRYTCSYWNSGCCYFLSNSVVNSISDLPMPRDYRVDKQQLLVAVRLFCETWSTSDNHFWEELVD